MRSLLHLLSVTLTWHVVYAVEGCEYSKDFVNASSSRFDIVVPNFEVEGGATTTCKTSCASGERSSLFLLYGGSASSDHFAAKDSDYYGCDMKVKIRSKKNQTKLGIFGLIDHPYINFTITCSCTKTIDAPPSGGGDICFSALDTVQIRNQDTPIAMKELKVGDYVKTGAGDKYQKVYGFGHRHETLEGEFLQLYYTMEEPISQSNQSLLPERPPLELSPRHLVFARDTAVTGEQSWPLHKSPVRADTVKPMDEIVHHDTQQVLIISRIERVYRRGLYMPLTPDGTIVINNDVLASNYVSIADMVPAVVRTGQFFGFSEHQLFHWWMAPYRLLCIGISSRFCAVNPTSSNNSNSSHPISSDHKDDGILGYLLYGKRIVKAVDAWDSVWLYLLGAGLMLVFGFLVFSESLCGPELAPLFIIIMLVWALMTALGFRLRLSHKNSR